MTVNCTVEEQRREGIRALLLNFMMTVGRECKLASLEECPYDTIMSVQVMGPATVSEPITIYHPGGAQARAELTPEAYFRLLVEFDLVEAHRLLHANKS